MPKPLVSIIIVNWNGKRLLKDCFTTLFNITYKNFEVIFVDNGSIDGSIAEIKKLGLKKEDIKKIKVVKNKTNLGFAEGNNVGYEVAKGELVLFLNNDTVIEKHFLEPLVKVLLSDPKIAGVQPKILAYPTTAKIDSVGSYLLSTGFLYHPGHNKVDSHKFETQDEIFTMKGACMLFKKDILDKIGVFETSYFAYFEETDMCHRVWLAGYKNVYTPKSIIYHKGGETAKRLDNSFLIYHSYKNRIYTYLKNLEAENVFKIVPLHILLCELASFAYLLKSQTKQAKAIQKAIWWNIKNWRNTIVARKKAQQLRTVSDSIFLPKIMRSVKPSYYYHLFASALAGYKD